MSNQVTSAQSCVTGVSNQNIFQDFFAFPGKIIGGINRGIESIVDTNKSSNAGTITGSAPPPGPNSPPANSPPAASPTAASPTHQSGNKKPDYIIYLYGNAQLGLSYDETSSENVKRVSSVTGNANNLDMLDVGDQFEIESGNGVKKVMIYSGNSNPSEQKEPHQPQYVFILPSDHELGLGYNKDQTNPSKGDIFKLGSKIENLGCIHIGDHVEVKTGANGNKIVVITKKVEPVTHMFANQWTLNGDLMVLHDPYAPPL